MKEQNYLDHLVGVFGQPVAENPGVVIQDAAFEAMGLERWHFLTLDVDKDKLEDAINGLKAFKMRGINCTIPHKIEVMKYLDEISESAKLIGAVNTIVNDNGHLFGENTDGKGFVEALAHEGEKVEGRFVTILGAGGAARAIAVECALAGAAKVMIINRTLSRAEVLADLMPKQTPAQADAGSWEKGRKIPEGTDILINATCVGFGADSGNMPDIDYNTITPDMVVSDVVFNPVSTLFLQEAAGRGAKTVSGLGMLACQGARNFTLWTGCEAPLQVMEDKLREEFESN